MPYRRHKRSNAVFQTVLSFRVESYEICSKKNELPKGGESIDQSEWSQLVSYVSGKFRMTASDKVEQDYERIEQISNSINQKVEVWREDNDWK